VSKEVGSGHVSIFPVFRGLKKAIAKEVGDGVNDAESVATRGMGQVGDRAGAALGRGLKSAMDTSSGDLGSRALAGLQKEVAAASATLSRARLKQQDDAGRVRVAEQRLADVMAKSPAGSAAVVAAEERLASARRKLEESTARVSSASTGLASAQARLTSLQDQLTAATERMNRTASRPGMAQLRGHVSNLFAPVTALTRGLGNLASRGLEPLGTRLAGFGRSVVSNVTNAVRPAATAVGDFGTQLAYRVTSGLVTASNTIRSKFAPALAAIKPATDLMGRSLSGAVGIARTAMSGIAAAAGPVVSAVSSAFGRMAQSVGGSFSGLATFARGQMAAVAAAAVAVVGAALKGGFDRLSAIENATARMRGLGLTSTQVAGAMKTAEQAALGTAFGLDEMAGAASQALTAGVDSGDELAAYLEAVKGAAVASNSPLSEMASIFGKVRTSGRAYTQEINQLAERQIPIWDALASEIGVSVDEVRNMASEGKITAEVYENAVRSATGGMAAEVGQTTAAAWANAGAALRRFGVALLGSRLEGDRIVGGLFPLFKQFADVIRGAFDAASAAITPFMQAFTDGIAAKVAPVLEGLIGTFARIKGAAGGFSLPDMSGIGSAFAVLAPAIGGVVGMLGPLLKNIPILKTLFGGLTGPVGILAGGLAMLFAFDASTLTEGFSSLTSMLTGGLSSLTGMLVDVVPGLVSGLGARLAENAPALLNGAAQLFTGLVDALVIVVPQLLTMLTTVLVGLIPQIVAMVPTLVAAAVTLFNSLLTGLVQALPVLLAAIVGMIGPLITALLSALPTLIQGALTLFLGIAQGLLTAIPAVIVALVDMLPQLLTTLIGMLPTLIQSAITLFLGLVLGLVQAIPQLIVALIGALPKIVGALIQMAPTLLSAAVQLFLGLLKGLVQAIPQIMSELGRMGPKIVAEVGKIGPALLNAGKALIGKLIDGIKQMFGAVGDAVGGLVDFAKGFFPGSPARWGPLSGAGWRAIGAGGEALVEEFARGANRADVSIDLGRAAAVQASFSAPVVSGAGRTGDGGGLLPPVYVENPFTGEYLLARVGAEARSSATAVAVGVASPNRRGGRR